MPGDQKVKAEKVMELNPEHPLCKKLDKLFENDKDTLTKYCKLLYNQALLIEGLPVDDPVEFSQLVCELMSE